MTTVDGFMLPVFSEKGLELSSKLKMTSADEYKMQRLIQRNRLLDTATDFGIPQPKTVLKNLYYGCIDTKLTCHSFICRALGGILKVGGPTLVNFLKKKF